MELDPGTWLRARAGVHRATRVAELLALGMALVLLISWLVLPGLFLVALLLALVTMGYRRRLARRLGDGEAVASLHAEIRASGPDLTRRQVVELLRDGQVRDEGRSWVTVHQGTQVRLIVEGSEPGSRARPSSPWVWATGGGRA